MSVTTPGPDPSCYCYSCKQARLRRARYYEANRHLIIRKNVARKQYLRSLESDDAELDRRALKYLESFHRGV